MLHKTKGIVLRVVKFGETSIIVTIITEMAGLQSYLVNGIRTVYKKGNSKASFFQPSAILELVAYKNETRNLQRLKEYRWAFIYQHILSDVAKNAVALYMIELLTKCLKQPEANAELFYFVEDALRHLDAAEEKVTANFPVFFALHLALFFGMRISGGSSGKELFLDLREGTFTDQQPVHADYLHDREAAAVNHILKVMRPEELKDLMLNQEIRRNILHGLEIYYAYHIPEFGTMKTLPVLKEIMN